MNNIFKDVEIGDEVFNYYYQIWGKVVDCKIHAFLVSYILYTGDEVRHLYDYDQGSGWLSGHRTQEVFTEEISPLPADDLSNLQRGDQVFVQPYQKWAEVARVLPEDAGFDILILPTTPDCRRITTTTTGLFSEVHKAPILFLGEESPPSEILTKLAGFYEFL